MENISKSKRKYLFVQRGILSRIQRIGLFFIEKETEGFTARSVSLTVTNLQAATL